MHLAMVFGIIWNRINSNYQTIYMEQEPNAAEAISKLDRLVAQKKADKETQEKSKAEELRSMAKEAADMIEGNTRLRNTVEKGKSNWQIRDLEAGRTEAWQRERESVGGELQAKLDV